ncbi:PAS domain S-box protein [Rhizobium sp. 32-5/1]|uniref:PAS domain-containing sensor histidine kinase n=1 Tax=Rhizobium sp. 32-5/1 TaxID=3019602 RepID=UPI00240D9434|nr:PAS domain S-box protein [Rhizobium sp. 32-5/1]WEZ83387.1 PAS domain S-box protein [Rhizobium sp. 32-5/1]
MRRWPHRAEQWCRPADSRLDFPCSKIGWGLVCASPFFCFYTPINEAEREGLRPPMQDHFARALYETFPEPVVVVDQAKTILAVNQAATQQFGHAEEELLGQHVRMIYATDEDYTACLSKRSIEGNTGAISDSVYQFKRKDGTVFSAELRSTLVTGPDGESCGFIGVIQDISDMLKLDKARRDAREILDTALAAIPEGFAIFDRNERLLVFNEAYRRVCGPAGPILQLGMTAEDIIRIAYEGGHYPDAPVGSPGALEWIESRLFDFRNPTGLAKVFPYGNGRWLRVENFKAKDGNTIALRVDVTAMKQTEIALERQRQEYLSLLQNIPDLVGRFTPAREILFVNSNYADFFGTTPEAMVGTDLLAHVPEHMQEATRRAFSDVQPEAGISSQEVLHVRPGQPDTWILWSLLAVFDGTRVSELISVGRDITTQMRQQERIARQSAELQRKNDALNQFTGTVSHDLKAPLRHIAMFSDMINDDIRSGNIEELPGYAAHLRQSARRMDRLIESLLDYSQIAYQIGTWSLVPLSDVVADAILNLGSQIRGGGAKLITGDLPMVHGDAELLKRLAQNLIGNAVKYRRPDVEPVIRVYGESTDDTDFLYVEDNGIGIEPRFATKIFDVFQRLHRDESVYSGTGIGLALAKRIVESHNGRIALDTSFTKGARFIVAFPKNKSSGKE